MVIELVVIMSLILQKALCNEDRTYLIEQSNVRGIKLGEEVHWTLDLNGSYIVESVRINVTFVDNQLFWMKVNDKKVSKICNQSLSEENGWMVIKCNGNLVVGRQLIIATSFTKSDLINNNLLIDVCSMTAYPLIDSNITMDSSLNSENNIVYYENVSCKIINHWSNYTWWMLIDIKEEVFVESFTFYGKEFEVMNVDIDKSVKAQVINQRSVNFNEDDTFCQLDSYFTCNKIGTYILIKGIAAGSAGYIICQAHIFGFKARGDSKMLEKRHGKCDFKILEKTYGENKATSNKLWMISLVVLSCMLILLCLVTWGILRKKLQIWSRADGWHLMQLLQRNGLQNPIDKFVLNPNLENEFLKLPNGFIRSSNIGRKPLHLDKNRFRNVIPFDENLVKLEGDQSNYINASFIRGFDGSPMAYIATQGPKTNTLNDFWKLVWQYKVDVIVMLLQMVENKCEQYWPDYDQHEATFGNISVSIVKECQFSDYVRRHLVVKKSNTNEMARSVVHMHFLSWNDMSAPNHCFPLLNFREKVNSFQMYSKSPLLVHCGAGIGRTGTYIAIDCLIKQAETAGEVSIYKCVKNLRCQRMNMVQNKDQYIFIFKAISEAGMLSDTGVNCIEFAKKFGAVLNQSSRTTKSFTRACNHSFEILMKTTQIDREDTCSRQKAKVTSQGRNLACDGQTFQTVSGANDFNASSIQCFKKSNAHILSQIPVPGLNFWKMLMENEVDQVLLLEDKCEPYWPGNNPIAIDGLKIHLQGEDRSNKYCLIRNFSVVDEKDIDPALNHKVTQYHLTKFLWPEHSQVPANKREFQKILKQLVKSNNRIVLQCLNGSERCGLTAAAMLMIDMILLDETVDPFLACRYVLASRPDAIFTQEQYQFLYQLALEYIQDCGKYTFMNSSNNLNAISDGSALSDYGIYHVLREY